MLQDAPLSARCWKLHVSLSPAISDLHLSLRLTADSLQPGIPCWMAIAACVRALKASCPMQDAKGCLGTPRSTLSPRQPRAVPAPAQARGALGLALSTGKSTETGSSSPVPCLGPGIGKGLGVGSASSQLLVTPSKNRPHHQHWPTAARPRCLGHCPSRLYQNLLSQAGQPPGALLSSQISSAPTNKTESGTPKPSSLRAHKPRQRLWHPSCT